MTRHVYDLRVTFCGHGAANVLAQGGARVGNVDEGASGEERTGTHKHLLMVSQSSMKAGGGGGEGVVGWRKYSSVWSGTSHRFS